MTLFRFTISLHGYRPGSVANVSDEARPGVQPLIDAGYLVPLEPEQLSVPVPARYAKRLTASGLAHPDGEVREGEIGSLDENPAM